MERVSTSRFEIDDSRSYSRVLLVLLASASATIGFGYAGFYAWPALLEASERSQSVAFEVAHLMAASSFAVLQVVAVISVLRRKPSFLAWLTPAAVYLFAIGIGAWLRAGEVLALGLDSARGMVLLGVGIWHWRELRRSPGPSSQRSSRS